MVIFRIKREVDIHSFVSCKNNDVYDDSAYGFRYSMVVGENVCKVCDHYDDEKAEFQYGLRPQFPRDDINPFRTRFDDFGRVLGLILVSSSLSQA